MLNHNYSRLIEIDLLSLTSHLDGPYGESPREEEGQADLEKFFDDHLGASERDGMDKENLPSNIVPVLAPMNRY